MALRSDELHREHFMHLVEAGRIPGVRVVDRWLFSPNDLDAYRRSRYGELEDMAKEALEHPAIDLTEKQEIICRHLVNSERPSEIARKLKQSRQAVHSQITLIREKVSRIQPKKASTSSTYEAPNTSRKKNEPIPFRSPKSGQS